MIREKRDGGKFYHPQPSPTPEQFRQAGDSINKYFEVNRNRGVAPEKIAIWEFSLNWHAFQMYANCKDNKMMQPFLQKAIKQFKAMSPEDLEELKKDYGPTVKPYLEATLIFLSDTKNKKQQLDIKLAEILKTPISEYPERNVVFFPGRVHDMAKNPDASYDYIFSLPTKLPPLPKKSDWLPANTPKEVENYVRAFKKETAALQSAEESPKMPTPSSVKKDALTPLKALHDPASKGKKKETSDKSVDVTAEEMEKSAFGRGSNTAKSKRKKIGPTT